MAKKKILQDSSGQIWPVTVADCVYLTDGSKNLKKYIDDGLAEKSPTHSHPYLPTAGGTMTGSITLNNSLALITKTAAAITDTAGATVAAGTTIKILEYNSSDNLHLGRDIYEKKLTKGSTYLSGGSGMTIRTNAGSISLTPAGTTVMSLSDSQVDVSKLIYAKAGIKSGGNIVSDTALTDSLGTSTVPWNLMYAKGLGLRSNSTGTTVGSVEVETVGTTSAVGSTRLILGNNVASGTNTNSKGYIKMYGTNTGYTDIAVGNNTTSNITLTLPSSTGTLISSSQATFTTMPKFNMNDRNGSIFEIFGGDANGHGVRFGGGGCTFISSGESAANIITAESTSPTEEQLYVTSDNNIHFYTKCGTIADRRKVTLNGSLNFYPDKAISGSIGHADYPWSQMFSDTYHLYGSAGKTYGYLNVQTVGTTSTAGEVRLALGNGTAEGTADNAWGRILLYTKSAGYTYIQPGDNTIGITLTLPTAGGTLATTANINSKVADYLPLAGGTMSGSLTLNNNVVIRSKTAGAYTNTNTNASIAAGSTVNIIQYNDSGNLHLGSGLYDNYLSTGSVYINSPNNVLYRTRNDGYHQFQINGSAIFNIKTTEVESAKNIYAKAGVKTGGNIVSDTAFTDNVGTDAIPFNYTKSRYFQIFGDASKQYGNLRADVLGTTSTEGKTVLTLGNSTASGTAGNAQGEINIYSSGAGYVKLKNRTSLSDGVTVELPSASGQLPIMKTDANNYWGILPPSGTESSWLRSPQSGLVPYEKNSEVSSLGTSSWPWYNVCGKNFISYDKNGQSYAYMKVATDGTASTQGEARLQLGNNISTGAAKNAYGRIQMYGTNTGYTMITPGNNSTSNITLTLPSSGGTLARTADNVASATKLNTERTLTIGKTGKSFDGSANVSWTLKEIMQGQGLTYDTPAGTLYVKNGTDSCVTRLAGYNNASYGDYAQLGICDGSGNLTNYINVYTDNITLSKRLYINSGGIEMTAGGNIAVNESKTTNYYALDIHRKCDSGSATYSTARFGCVNTYGGCAQMETRQDGATVGYLTVLPNGGIRLGSGKKLHIQASAPTENVATGDIWIDI